MAKSYVSPQVNFLDKHFKQIKCRSVHYVCNKTSKIGIYWALQWKKWSCDMQKPLKKGQIYRGNEEKKSATTEVSLTSSTCSLILPWVFPLKITQGPWRHGLGSIFDILDPFYFSEICRGRSIFVLFRGKIWWAGSSLRSQSWRPESIHPLTQAVYLINGQMKACKHRCQASDSPFREKNLNRIFTILVDVTRAPRQGKLQ